VATEMTVIPLPEAERGKRLQVDDIQVEPIGVPWMPPETSRLAWSIEDKLLAVWEEYIKTIGPTVVKAYRDGSLNEQPYEDLLSRVSERMKRMAMDLLLDEELAQDDGKHEVNHVP
jgi:hypothetical protein